MLDALAVGPVLFFFCCCCGCFWYQACMGLLQLLINSLFFMEAAGDGSGQVKEAGRDQDQHSTRTRNNRNAK